MERISVSPLLKNKRIKTKLLSAVSTLLKYIILIVIGYLVLYPLVYMLSYSFRSHEDFIDPGVIWIPKHYSLIAFGYADKAIGFKKAILNSVLFEIISALIEVMTCAVVAYGMARFRFRGKTILTILLFAMILLPDQMLIVPKMMNDSNLDFLGIIRLINKISGAGVRIRILDTGWAFWLPSLFGVGLKAGIIIFIYIQFFKGLPKELEEAAWIDGANLVQTYTKIALPSSSVVFATTVILSIIWHWNDYYLAVMYTSSNFPVAVKIAQMTTNLQIQNIWPNNPEYKAACCAACLIFILPMMLMYMVLQRKFVESIDRVGITG